MLVQPRRDGIGIRQTEDQVEQLGVLRSRKALEQADAVLCLFDISAPWTSEDEEILNALTSKTIFVLFNKIDLPAALSVDEIQKRLPPTAATFQISITRYQGIAELKQALVEHVLAIPLESVEVTNSRHTHALTLAQHSLRHARKSTEQAMSQEFIALDLRNALDHLGSITGETTTEDILQDIFSTFCIGK